TLFAQCSAPGSSRPKIIVMKRPSIHCASRHPLDFYYHHLAKYTVPIKFLGFRQSGTPSDSGHSLRQ
ncbi:hypothetical protein NEOLEDRAFT_1141881, partial [Neolentinus lepideus HHB14362 ss-1]